MRILSLLVVLLLAGVGAQAETWVTYESQAGRFRVDMPGKPEESQQTSPMGNPLSVAMLVTTSAAYLVMFADAPPNTHAFGLPFNPRKPSKNPLPPPAQRSSNPKRDSPALTGEREISQRVLTASWLTFRARSTTA